MLENAAIHRRAAWAALLGLALVAAPSVVIAATGGPPRARRTSARADSAAWSGANAGTRAAMGAYGPGANDLGADNRPAWRPDRPVPRREPWEQVLLLPGRIVSLPFVGLGTATERALLWGEDRGYIALRPPEPAHGHSRIGVGGSELGDRAGLGGALQWREPIGRGRNTMVLGVRQALTLNGYSGTWLDLQGRPASFELGDAWRPRERFYGLGPSSSRRVVSGYASHVEWARAGLHFAAADSGGPRSWPVLELEAGPRRLVTGASRERGVTAFDALDPALAPVRDRRLDHVVTGVRLAIDSRTGQPHWVGGARLAASAQRFDPTGGDGARFMRYQLEGETGVSFRRDPRTLRLLVRVEDQRVLDHAERFALADYATLGGSAGLGGFTSGRFHDLDAAQAKLSYIFPISRRLEVDLHSEWGQVSHDVWRDTRLAGLEHSVGFAVRPRWEHGVIGSAGMDFSREQWRVTWTLGGLR